MALGYDWLYSDLTADERAAFRAAIVAKGLAPGVEAITAPSFWAAQGRNTWSEVCFGGLTLGALAVAEHAPELAASVLGALQGPGLSSAPAALCARTAATSRGPATGATRRCT